MQYTLNNREFDRRQRIPYNQLTSLYRAQIIAHYEGIVSFPGNYWKSYL